MHIHARLEEGMTICRHLIDQLIMKDSLTVTESKNEFLF